MSRANVKLGDVCVFVRGPFGGALKKDFFVEQGFCVYEQQHAIYNQFEDVRYFIDEFKFDELKRFELHPGDLIMSCSGTMGKVAKVPKGIKKGVINQALLKLTPHEELDLNYLKYWLESETFQFRLNGHTHGAAIKNVASVAVLKEMEIPLPPLAEQKRIAAILDKAHAIHHKRQQAIQLADEFLRSLFLDMFGDPVTNSKGWELSPLSQACGVSGGGTPSKSEPNFWGGNIPWVSPKDMKFDFISDSKDKITELAIEKSSTKLIPVNSVLMVVRSGVLKHTVPLGITAVEVAINQDMKAYIPKECLNSEYLFYCLDAFSQFLLSTVRGTTADNLSSDVLNNLLIPIPERELQNKFKAIVLSHRKLLKDYNHSARDASQNFNSLSQKAFAGEL